jgi:hypothetical protein
MISRYLAAYQLGYLSSVWDPFFTPGTKGVLESTVSRLFPVSDAGLGALAYTIEFFATCQGGTNRWRTAPWLVLVFGFLVIPVSVVSTILIILQPLAVGTWCTLCLITAILMLIAIPFAIAEVAATIQFLRLSQEKPFLKLLFTGGKCPQETPDTITPPLDSPLLTLFKASLTGQTYPWNLVLSSLAGMALIAIPSALNIEGLLYSADPILGAMITIVSAVSFSEIARKARWINLPLALALLSAALADREYFLLHALFALFIALLALRKGPIRSQFTFRSL